MDLRAGEQFTESVRQLAHERLVERLPTLRIRKVEAIEHGLGDNIVQLLEKLLF